MTDPVKDEFFYTEVPTGHEKKAGNFLKIQKEI